MSQYVSGKTIPRRDVAELLARILEVDVTWLLAGDADQGEASSPRNDSKPEPHPSAQIARSTTMRTFSKSTKLDNVLYDVRGPVVDEAARMEDEGERILKLNIGNPAPFGFRTPDEVIKDMRQQLARLRRLFQLARSVLCAQGDHAVFADQGPAQRSDGAYLHGQRRVRAHSAFDERAARQWRRDSDPQPRLSALDGVRNPCRRSSRTLSVR